MDSRERANQLVMEFGAMLTVDGLQLDPDNNSCVLLFDQEILLNIEYDAPADRMIFYVYLGELPQANAEPLLRELLSANLFWMRTRGATLALEEGTNGIILLYAHPLEDLDKAKFEAVVQNVVQQAENWKKRVGEIKAKTAVAESSGANADAGARPTGPVIFG
ncbi:MAG: type III secretion system chaperone [Candidatus Hydrogenedentes bacterium]|nr:type III secretion system chaperone [Candidatus Hydrogenedentota bacterium]